MTQKMPISQCPTDISETDVLEAMKAINGFIDITPEDFREIYRFAFQKAVERLNKSVIARDIMTSTVISVKDDTSLLSAAELMAANNISGLPVIDASNLVVGVISEKDFLYEMGDLEKQSFMGVVVQCLKNKGCAAISLRSQTAADIMSTPPITVLEVTTVSEIAAIFEEKNINRVPVVTPSSELKGIIARSDIIQSYCLSFDEQGTPDK